MNRKVLKIALPAMIAMGIAGQAWAGSLYNATCGGYSMVITGSQMGQFRVRMRRIRPQSQLHRNPEQIVPLAQRVRVSTRPYPLAISDCPAVARQRGGQTPFRRP